MAAVWPDIAGILSAMVALITVPLIAGTWAADVVLETLVK